ncbi:MAG TPA: hypothetical protein H9914_10640 [Candidatus Blautia avicola]|uniref:Uncharacterized protein n=1 Tax=Candidatus Blautia avicola TaxID=2838483 RepID=A0A9D2QY28_9FIRM|nr:hypothetical protein [Candidatus Blautia avicola]
MFKVFQNKFIPGMVQGFVQCKGFQRRACSTGKVSSVILKIQKQTENLPRFIGQSASSKELFCIFSGQAEDDLKMERGFLPFYDGKAKRFYISPQSVIPFFFLKPAVFFCVKKIFVEIPLDGVGYRSSYRGFTESERVKGIADQQLCHKIFNILNFYSNHINTGLISDKFTGRPKEKNSYRAGPITV